jgi:GTP cyclohydrolase I
MTDPVTLDGEGFIGEFDEKRAENAVRELLIAVGEDPDREGLKETPGRVARAYREIFAGLWQKPEDVLTTTFDLGHDEMVLVKDIEIYSTCEHHLVPFRGIAHVGYIPATSGKITGLSKLARLVDVYARRPQVQDRGLPHGDPGGARCDRGRRVRAHVHVDAGHPQARRQDDHVGGAGPAAGRGHPQ